ncbi:MULTISPECIES: GatB/YqeY domain-containing protein [Gammaproteobacteria]|uniref:GatB/YqeY domain-containing protein n=1 Tax=Gammaproteobacteria TaxID=1236 RepID=UPI0013D28DCB|nr:MULTISPECIES: GatB/YqeY domain-containing protein [Gammaproteobacteria]MBO9482750.1 GatB/YqeY domain-containing protein [Salinisphaera sp. G21_0]MBO9495833.1 GatB/YqeY domain-containing protein [Thalassotalea sp. G20_0]
MSDCIVRDQLTEAMKDAMRNRDKPRLGTIRLALAELKRIEVDEKSLDDQRALAVLDKMVKQRRDAIEQFESAGRTDLAEQEKLELEVLADFLPTPLSETEITELVDLAINSTGASGMADMGKVMGIVKPQAQGRADMSSISKIVKSRLS